MFKTGQAVRECDVVSTIDLVEVRDLRCFKDCVGDVVTMDLVASEVRVGTLLVGAGIGDVVGLSGITVEAAAVR